MSENLPGPGASIPPLSDEALAHALQQLGIATFDQLEAARLEQAAQAKNGILVSLAEVLVQQGLIAPATLENVVKKVRARAAGGIRQLGQYKLTRKLGEGGMGQVFLAEDTHIGRTVAVKVLPKKLADDHEFLTRFRREAIATGKLNHENIVCAYTVGEEQGLHYYAMEHCDGEPLDALLDRIPFIPWNLAAGVIMQAARGLQHAHDHGIVHRDIKPANIFICKPPGVATHPTTGSPLDILGEGYVAKILDLGLSKDLGNESSSFYTQSGVAMGTPHYISPEQARGEKQFDGRTDIYSLGATFYHLVTGETPFAGPTGAVIMAKHLTDQLPNPQDVNDEIPDGVVHVIQKMMAKAPADRYENCRELIEDLELAIDGKMPSSRAIEVSKSSVAVARRSAGGLPGEAVRSRVLAAHVRPPFQADEPLAEGQAADRDAGQAGKPDVRRGGERAPESGGPPRKTLYLLLGGAGLVVPLIAGFLLMGITEVEPTPVGPETKVPQPDTKPQTLKGQAYLDPIAAQELSEVEAGALRAWENAERLFAARNLQDAKEAYDAFVKAHGQTKTYEAKANTLKERLAAIDGVRSSAAELTVELGGGVKMEFVLVKPGEFQMGGPGKRERDWQGNEGPIHKVTITKPFYMGKYPVTVAPFAAFVEAEKYVTECEKGGNKGEAFRDRRMAEITGVNWKMPGFDQTPDHPVVLVSWNDTQAFVAWASKKTGYDVRLPTEAQWEWAARGSKSLEYPFGEQWDGLKVNHRDATLQKIEVGGCSNDNDGYAYTSPTGTFANASWCGAFDLSGNVWQWVQDWEADYTAEAQVDPVGPASGKRRVLRGGSWFLLPSRCRSAVRGRYFPDNRSVAFGFRVVLVGVPRTP